MKILELARRFVLVSAFGLWLGGFAFYTGIVIRAGHRHFSDRSFGFLTAEVTRSLEGCSLAAILLAALDLALSWKRRSRGQRLAALGVLVALAAGFAWTMAVRGALVGVLDPGAHRILDRERFLPLHERYELASSLEWGMGLIYVALLLAAWRRTDAEPGAPKAGTGAG